MSKYFIKTLQIKTLKPTQQQQMSQAKTTTSTCVATYSPFSSAQYFPVVDNKSTSDHLQSSTELV